MDLRERLPRMWIVALGRTRPRPDLFFDEGEAQQHAMECGGGIVLEVVSDLPTPEEWDRAIEAAHGAQSLTAARMAFDSMRLRYERALHQRGVVSGERWRVMLRRGADGNGWASILDHIDVPPERDGDVIEVIPAQLTG
jgi:hypothetical protein